MPCWCDSGEDRDSDPSGSANTPFARVRNAFDSRGDFDVVVRG